MIKLRKGKHARRVSHPAKRRPSRASFARLWLLTGLVLGILGATFVFQSTYGQTILAKLNGIASQESSVTEVALKSKKSAKPKKTKLIAQKNEPPQRFEFYQLLPGMEVPIPDRTEEKKHSPHILAKIETKDSTISLLPPAKPPLPKTQTKLAAAQYLIQAGAYRQLNSAESLQTRLHLQGFTPRIQKIEAEDGIWFRVTLGPFATEAIALNQKKRLARENIHGILILQRN